MRTEFQSSDTMKVLTHDRSCGLHVFVVCNQGKTFSIPSFSISFEVSPPIFSLYRVVEDGLWRVHHEVPDAVASHVRPAVREYMVTRRAELILPSTCVIVRAY